MLRCFSHGRGGVGMALEIGQHHGKTAARVTHFLEDRLTLLIQQDDCWKKPSFLSIANVEFLLE